VTSKQSYSAEERSELEVVSVRLSGEQMIDLFAYRGYLYGWNYENELVVYRVESLIDELEVAYGARGLSAAYALFCSRGIGATDDMKVAFRNRESRESLLLELSPQPLARAKNIARFKHVIDMKITYDRLYLATECGLFVMSLSPDQLEAQRIFNPDLEREGECLAVNTGLRAVGASFGNGGLYVVANESSEVLGPRRSWHLPITSVRSSIGAARLVNFPSQEESQTIPITVVRGENRRSVSLSEVSLDEGETSSLRTIGANSYVFWDSQYRRMFDVATRMADYSSRWFNQTYGLDSNTDFVPIKVVSAAFTGNSSLALETIDGIVLIREGGDHSIQSGPTVSMRTYRTSWRFRRLVTATSTNGVWLHAALGGESA